MGKWNKAPPQVSEEFLQNEQRRKQMIIEAAKRRKQKQKKLQQQAQVQKKNQQQALLKHKQEKKDAYVKYLRNNMHDKYEEMKRNQKQSQPQVRSKSKWKKDALDSNSQIKGQNNLEGLDLEVKIPNMIKISNNRVINKVGGQVVRNVPQAKYAAKPEWAYEGNKASKSPTKKQSQKRRLLQDEFQNMWKQEHDQPQKQIDYDLSMEETIFDDMLGSKLLDSLDLDLDTVCRGKKLDKKIKQEKKRQTQPKENKEIDEIKNLIGYESVLMSIDQRSEMIKKYNQFMVNEVQQLQTKKVEDPINKPFAKQKPNKNKVKQQPNNKNLNEGEIFNELKNKKEGKILNWAQGEAEEADDLFSNCSTSKKSKTRGFELLKQINKEIQQKQPKGKKSPTNFSNQNIPVNQQINMKKKEKPLQIIPEKKINSSLQKLRQRSFDKKSPAVQSNPPTIVPGAQNKSQEIRRNSSREKISEVNNNRPNRLNSAEIRNNQPPHPPRNVSRQRVNKTTTNSFKENNDQTSRIAMTQERNRSDSRRSLSKEKEAVRSSKDIQHNGQGYGRNPPLKVQQTASSSRQAPVVASLNNGVKRLPHLPPSYARPVNSGDEVTIATQDQVFEIESFIKNQLLSLNREQRQLQQQLKTIHINNKQRVKEVQKKYDIKTDYKYSYQLRQKQQGIDEQIDQDNRTKNSYQMAHKKQTQDQLQESIQRLDDMLLRKQINNKEKASRITEQDNESESTHRSLINPMSDPISLHKQVLRLAENLSRFEGEPEDPNIGYGAKLRMKKKSMEKENKTQAKKPQRISQQKRQTQIQLSQSQDVNFSELNSVQAKSKISKTSKVSKPPQLQYYQQGNVNIPPGYNESGLLEDDDDQGFQDSIEKGKIQVNQRLRRMLLD